MAVSFPNWAEVLGNEPWREEERERVRRDVIGFLRHCKIDRVPASITVAQAFIEAWEKQAGSGGSSPRLALRWFFKAAKAHGISREAWRVSRAGGGGGQAKPESTPMKQPQEKPAGVGADGGVGVSGDGMRRGVESTEAGGPPTNPGRSGIVPPAASDLGRTDWERDLVKASRVAGFLWRTEQTYRAWAARFAAFIAPQSPYRAMEVEVARFLTELAVKQRASASTQKQALSALVFFLQEGLHHQLGEIDFERAHPKRRMPVVMSRDECGRLFSKLEGMSRLMAELAYGSGLRLMEVLRLRVQDLDMARGRLMVRAGKGDKDRVTVLPERLQGGLTAHLDWLRKEYAKDRAAGLAGVWLPEGLDRKYRRAGETWEWQWLFVSSLPRGAPARPPCASLRASP